MEQVYNVTGMSCAGCAARVEKCVAALPGVTEVHVNLPAKLMKVVSESAMTEEITAAVRRTGFGAELLSADAPLRVVEEKNPLGRRALGSVLLLIPLVVAHLYWHHVAWVQLLIVLPIVWLNRAFFIKGFSSLVQRAPGMDALVALGSGVALADGIVHIALGTPGAVYFESAGMILSFVSVGKWLESRATQRTGKALERLTALMPDTATALRGGQEIDLPVAALRPGDEVLVRPGERVPADAVVSEGVSSVDESALTGESMPVEKMPGCGVYAGTVNRYGALRIRVSCVSSESALSGIIRLVRDAAADKAPVARMADRIAAVFVPVVVALACLTAVAWVTVGSSWDFALARAVAVLVISCPCALGLATPVAIMAGAGRGAEWGVLFRSGEALESAGRTNCVLLDKTGTLTQGEPSVTDILPQGGDAASLLRIAAALESEANHPLAKAILQAAEGEEMLTPVTEHTYLPGRGVQAIVQGVPCAAGNAAFMRELGICIQDDAALADAGKTLIHISRAGVYMGALAVADTPRTTAAQAVQELREVGMRVGMVTGDQTRTAKAIAARVGVEEVYAEALPQDKEALVRRLQSEGCRVAMVGDGINDAPALARADAGIAIGAGTDIAIESAGIILMRSDPLDIVRAIKLSRAILRNIRQNLFFAFVYNVLAIPLAAGVFYPLCGALLHPAVASAAMGMSSICVVMNALRLRRFSCAAPAAADQK